MAPPFRLAVFDLMHDERHQPGRRPADLAIEDKMVEKSGAWISYGD